MWIEIDRQDGKEERQDEHEEKNLEGCGKCRAGRA